LQLGCNKSSFGFRSSPQQWQSFSSVISTKRAFAVLAIASAWFNCFTAVESFRVLFFIAVAYEAAD